LQLIQKNILLKKLLQIAIIFFTCFSTEQYFCSGGNSINNKVPALNYNSRVKAYSSFDSDTISDTKFSIYVNQGILNIKYPFPQELEEGEVVVFNMLGQVILRKKLETSALNQVLLPIHNTCYIVRITYSGKVYTQKIILTAY
jgi:hypothetical protein